MLPFSPYLVLYPFSGFYGPPVGGRHYDWLSPWCLKQTLLDGPTRTSAVCKPSGRLYAPVLPVTNEKIENWKLQRITSLYAFIGSPLNPFSTCDPVRPATHVCNHRQTIR